MLSPVKIWRNQKKIKELLGKAGKIVSWTLVRIPLAGFSDQAPYPVVIVELENNKRITCQMVDFDNKELRTGQKVLTIVRRITEPDADGIIPYGIKVKPVETVSISNKN